MAHLLGFWEVFFLNPWVARYLMPVFLGSWRALITAKIIYIREMKTRVVPEMVQLHLRFGRLDFETHRELEVKTTLLYQARLLIGEDLHRRLFFDYEAHLQKTYSDHTALVLECIRKGLFERLPVFTDAQREAFALNPGEALLREGFAKSVRNPRFKQPNVRRAAQPRPGSTGGVQRILNPLATMPRTRPSRLFFPVIVAIG